MRSLITIPALLLIAGCSSSQATCATGGPCIDAGAAPDLGTFSFGDLLASVDLVDPAEADLGTAMDLAMPTWVRHVIPTGPLVVGGFWGTGPMSVFAGTSKGLFYSNDGGMTWQPRQLPGHSTGVSAFAGLDANNVVVGGAGDNHDVIYRSADGGQSWDIVWTGTQAVIQGIGGTSQILYAVGFSPEFLSSADGGKSWAPAAGPPAVNKGGFERNLFVETNGTIWTGGAVFGLFKSDNGGMSWVDRTPVTTFQKDAIAAWGEGDEIFAVAEGGAQIFHSVDGGKIWVEQTANMANAPPNERLWNVWGLSASNVYIVGDKDVLLHSTDHGSHWIQEVPIGLDDLQVIWASGPDDVWVGGAGPSVGIVYHYH